MAPTSQPGNTPLNSPSWASLTSLAPRIVLRRLKSTLWSAGSTTMARSAPALTITTLARARPLTWDRAAISWAVRAVRGATPPAPPAANRGERDGRNRPAVFLPDVEDGLAQPGRGIDGRVGREPTELAQVRRGDGARERADRLQAAHGPGEGGAGQVERGRRDSRAQRRENHHRHPGEDRRADGGTLPAPARAPERRGQGERAEDRAPPAG